MSGIPLLFGRATRRTGRLPSLENENMFAEPTATAQEKGLVLIGRPGLTRFADLVTGPVRAMFQQPGIFDGDRFVVAGTVLYRIPQNGVVETVLGDIEGNERVQMAGGLGPDAESEIRIVNGDGVYLYDGLTVAAETTPDDIGFTSIEFILGCWVAVRTDSQELYFRFIDSATWDPLDFESAEFKPDKAVCVRRLGDQLVVFGEASVQLFAYTGDPTFPLQPYGAGLVNEIGCRARDSVARVRDTLFFVGDDCQVFSLSPGLEAISDPGLTEILRGAAANTLVAWGYILDGHEYYVLNTEAGSFIHDRMTKFWSKASTYGEAFWRPWFGVQVADRVLCADGVGAGTLWYLDPEALDDDGDPIVRRFTAWLEIPEGRMEVGNLVLNAATGWSPQAGQGSAPLMKVRAYRDETVPGPWREASLGSLGRYGREVRWNRFGQFKSPGALFEFEVSDPVVVRVNSVRANVP